mgnify:CR=1 FL=1
MLRQPLDPKVDTASPEYKKVQAVINRALEELQKEGATLVDPLDVAIALRTAAGRWHVVRRFGLDAPHAGLVTLRIARLRPGTYRLTDALGTESGTPCRFTGTGSLDNLAHNNAGFSGFFQEEFRQLFAQHFADLCCASGKLLCCLNCGF